MSGPTASILCDRCERITDPELWDLDRSDGDARNLCDRCWTICHPAPTLELHRDDYRAAITERPDGTVGLWWTDYVANDWSEEFPTVAEALCSLAALEACRASDWEKSFSPDLDGATTAFLSSAVA